MKVSWSIILCASLLEKANAYPQIAVDFAAASENPEKRQLSPPHFNAAQQYVSTSGKYKFVAPGPTDQRGPCPALNALANHGYLPHNGIGTIEDFITSTFTGFGMGADLSGFLGVYGAIFDGDLTQYSIGFASSQLPVISGMLGTPQGLGGSHNKYENDASPMRGDLYTYGNSYKTQVPLFEQFYNTQAGVPDDQVNFDLDIIREFRKARFDDSIANNPYFFNGPFSGAIASPAAYTFIFRFMANKSEEYPEGRLDRNVLKSFYAITGKPGSFEYTPGHERFPENWYKRAIGDEYTIPFFFTDALAQDSKYPEFLSIGGNTGTVNSFAGIDPSNLTGGVYNLQNLQQGNNLACYSFELASQTTPDLLEGIFTDVTPAKSLLAEVFANATSKLGCPKLRKLQYGQEKLKAYPGYGKSYDGYTGL